MNKYLEKRDSLEQFIREQTLGPGVRGYRFVDITDHSLFEKDLLKEKPIHYKNEIIDVMPASVYSTGILFPKDNTKRNQESNGIDNEENNKEDEKEFFLKQNTLDDVDEEYSNEDSNGAESETIDLNQMYPMTMGVTFCLDEKFLDTGNLSFSINARIYKKFQNIENVAVLCEVSMKEFQDFLNINSLVDFFQLFTQGLNNIVTLKKLDQEKYSELKENLNKIAKKEAERIYIDKIQNKINSMSNKKSELIRISSLIQSIYYELKNNYYNWEMKKKLYEISQELELVENIIGHLNGLLDTRLIPKKQPWSSQQIKLNVLLENIKFPKIENKNKQFYMNDDLNFPNAEIITVTNADGEISKGLKNIFFNKINEKEYASLSANIQLSRDTRKENNKTFVKIQLINDSSPFVKDTKGNTYYSVATQKVNNKCFFGVNISVANDYLIPYTDYNFNSNNGVYDEETTTKFIYRQFKDFAIGHGCSAKWEISDVLKKIETEYLPTCETPDIEPIPRNKNIPPDLDNNNYTPLIYFKNKKVQEFKWLSVFSDTSDEDVVSGLSEFVDSYNDWIDLTRSQVDGKYIGLVNQELEKCKSDYIRMKVNIENLLSGKENEQNLKCFRLMNGSMFMQLLHSNFKRQDFKELEKRMSEINFINFDFNFYKSYDEKEDRSYWRAFQLAFILLNLDGIFQQKSDKDWKYRNQFVDLVWFPTGGGKTEAYLGLIALTIINRRLLHGEKGGGTAVIMRYTLRLLTTQQFQRATLLIMALELIRRWGLHNLGNEPITIGLWVGDNSLPNKIKDLIDEFQKLRSNEKANRIPFSICPWCGSELRPDSNEVSNTENVYNYNKVPLSCTNSKCNFKRNSNYEGLSVNLCDESIYQHPPTLLFGTVDKFAQLAHKVTNDPKNRHKDSRRLFGKGNWEKGKPKDGYLPPDLIIQDELHLLLGPLGSAVALFESAVDQLCTRKDGTRPKIISSTATTRNTELQIAALFNRKVNLFPKPGIDCDDSFFAFYKRTYSNKEKDNEKYLSKRKYIGFLPTGRTQIWMQMRLAAILFTHRAIFELKELGENSPIDFDVYEPFSKIIDFYHTVVSYFNSLKEVGKTQSQVQSYIKKEIKKVFSGIIRPKKLMNALYAFELTESELTGRLSGQEVKTNQFDIEQTWDASRRFAHISENDKKENSGKIPPEFVVATNMISVGLDISRFNAILVNSMPRNIAEYIQATSRVARREPGIVLTIHHPFRARDVSHYEKFIEFHEKMYSYVEPISITPFTFKSVDRYLGLYLATILRHINTKFTDRNSANDIGLVNELELQKMIEAIVSYFIERKKQMEISFISNKSILYLLKENNISYIKKWIEEALEEWKKLKNKMNANSELVFNNRSEKSSQPQQQLYVDIEEYDGNIHSKKWQIPMSLRVIEPEASIRIHSK